MDDPQRELVFLGPAPGFSVLLKRNCSITPKGLMRVFVLLALLSLGIGVGFAFAGAWLILPFAGLEVLVLAGAFLLVARHATDYERIELAQGRLTVEIGSAGTVVRHAFEPHAARVQLERRGARSARVLLRARDRVLEIGRHLDLRARERLADELRQRLGH